VLSFHIISQIGYMVLGLALVASPDPATRQLGLAAGVFYIAHHIVVKTNLFLIGGTIHRLQGSYDLKKTGGLLRSQPWLAVVFFVPAFSLAGIPPLSGFWAKLSVIRAGLIAGEYAAVGVALFAGLLTLMSMVKIWNEAFWKPAPSGEAVAAPARASRRRLGWMVAPSVCLAVITIAIGIFPQPLFRLAEQSARELSDPAVYERALELEVRE
jgi:multicomponent Na+:H+ antiporter subunit D